MSRAHHPPDPCGGTDAPDGICRRPPLERLRFWNGRFLVARDLRDQQEDLIRRIEYHQSFAHGEGILCGFHVEEHPREDCRTRWIVVGPGMGYDCCGRTLWLTERRAVEVPWPERDDDGEDRYEPGPDAPEKEEREEWERGEAEERRRQENEERRREEERARPDRHPDPEWFVLACPVQCPTDPMPALYADDLCDPVRHEHGRLREDVALRVVPASEVPDACWPRRRPVTEVDCVEPGEDDCDRPLGDAPPCGGPCDCGECLVLAALWREPRTGLLRWDTTHRKVLAPDTDLTRISGVNWPHGGDLSIRRLYDEMEGRFVVRFSRPLQPADGLRNGVNRMTYRLSFLGMSGAWEEIVPPDPDDMEGDVDTPRLSENRRCAVFDVPRRYLRDRSSIVGSWVRVRLACDFLIDCHGRAVSGAHLGGDVQGRGSGNGVQGGIFESWCYITSAGGGGR